MDKVVRVIPPEDLPLYGIRFSRSQLHRKYKDGSFPRPIQLGRNRIGWIESEIQAWLKGLIAERDANPTGVSSHPTAGLTRKRHAAAAARKAAAAAVTSTSAEPEAQ